MYLRLFSWPSGIHEQFLSNAVQQGAAGASGSLGTGRLWVWGVLQGGQGRAWHTGPVPPPQPGTGQVREQPQRWALGTYLGMGTGWGQAGMSACWWGSGWDLMRGTGVRHSLEMAHQGHGNVNEMRLGPGSGWGSGVWPCRAWLQSAQAETMPDTIGLNLLPS